MNESRIDSEASLPQFLSARARQASDTRLALDAGCGFVVALAAALWHGPFWHVITSAALCFLAYGAWGIADRELAERVATTHKGEAALRTARIVAATVGVCAAISLIVLALFVLLGRLIS